MPAFSIGGVGNWQLRLSGQVLAAIYVGSIGKWNDRAIAALNPGLPLPDAKNYRRSSLGRIAYDLSLGRLPRSLQASRGVPASARAPASSVLSAWPKPAPTGSLLRFDGPASRSAASSTRTRRHRLTHAALRNGRGVFVKPSAASFAAATQSANWQTPDDLNRLLVEQAEGMAWHVTGPAT